MPTAAPSQPDGVVRSEHRTMTVMLLVLLPWLAAVLLTAGVYAAFVLCAYAVLILAVGYMVLGLALPPVARAGALPLAPAMGILLLSGLTEFCLRLKLPLVDALLIWIPLAAVGAFFLVRDWTICRQKTVAYGKTLACLSLLICGIYFLPGAYKDAVLRSDGSFNWMYVDSQCHYLIAEEVRNNVPPPKTYGTATADLSYHFGPYAPAGVISRFSGLDLGHAYARVTRGASVWALILSCFLVGTFLALEFTRQAFGGILTVGGLFFYGSLLSLFTDARNSSSSVSGAILFKIPGIEVQADGGPFSHLILGHSMLHALGAITAIMGVCLAQRRSGSVAKWRQLILLALPAVALGVNSIAALYCLGIVAILLFWEHLHSLRSWLLIALMFALFLGALRIAGYTHSQEAEITTINTNPGGLWGPFVAWFIVGLGFRLLAFRWISRPWKDPLAALLLASVIGFLAFNLTIHTEQGDEHYGMYLLQCIFSLFAFSQLTPGFWRKEERSQWAQQWFHLATRGLAVLLAAGVLLRLVILATHSNGWVNSFKTWFLPCVALILLFLLISWGMKRTVNFAAAGSTVLMGVLAIGFLAWIAPWLNYGMGRMKMDVTLSPGEVRGLKAVAERALPEERFATNKHSFPNFPVDPARSYAYASLAQHPVLLEGYAYRGVSVLPWFKDMLHDNDLMFLTRDPETLRELARKWHVNWLVARPATDIALPSPLPSWLSEQQNTGDLKIYRIEDSAGPAAASKAPN